MLDRHQHALDFAVAHVKRLRPGQRVVLSYTVLQDIAALHHKGAVWTPPDRVLENIIGSSYEFRYEQSGYKSDVTFERLSTPLTNGHRSYVSPDRRNLYNDLGPVWAPKSGNEI